MNETHLIPPPSPHGLALVLLAWLTVAGCHHEEKVEAHSVTEPPAVQVVLPQMRDIVRVVGQPSFVEAYERTSIYPKLTGYIQNWNVDIGDRVYREQVLADLFVPEIVEEWHKKGATVEYDRSRVKLAEKAVVVAVADVRVAAAKLKAARASWAQYREEVLRWDSEVRRLRAETERGVVDPQVLLESENRLRGSIALRQTAAADVVKAGAELESQKATLSEDQVAVKVAQADVEVAQSDWKRLGTWADTSAGQKPYIKLFAPFDGVVVARNANTWDFVLPAAGDPSADNNAPYLSPSGQAAPIYVVDRTDVVRIFVDIPEHAAEYVKVGAKASVLISAFRGQPIFGTVTRTSWALQVGSRTLRAEIDLPNVGSALPNDLPPVVRQAIANVKLPETESQILPGMYAYGKVIIERPRVLALPRAALFNVGERTYCYRCERGKAVRLEIEAGLSDTKNKWVEVTSHRRVTPGGAILHGKPPDPPRTTAAQFGDPDWTAFDGSEQVILGDLSILTDGEPVRVIAGSGESKKTHVGPKTI